MSGLTRDKVSRAEARLEDLEKEKKVLEERLKVLEEQLKFLEFYQAFRKEKELKEWIEGFRERELFGVIRDGNIISEAVAPKIAELKEKVKIVMEEKKSINKQLEAAQEATGNRPTAQAALGQANMPSLPHSAQHRRPFQQEVEVALSGINRGARCENVIALDYLLIWLEDNDYLDLADTIRLTDEPSQLAKADEVLHDLQRDRKGAVSCIRAQLSKKLAELEEQRKDLLLIELQKLQVEENLHQSESVRWKRPRMLLTASSLQTLQSLQGLQGHPHTLSLGAA